MRPTVTAEDAYAVCEQIAATHAQATARNAYGDGYRAASERIAHEVRSKRIGRIGREKLDRDLRDAEVEARTFARVIETATQVVESFGMETVAADAVRAVVGAFFLEEDLPPILRKRERGSGVCLSERPGAASPSAPTTERVWAQASGSRRSRSSLVPPRRRDG